MTLYQEPSINRGFFYSLGVYIFRSCVYVLTSMKYAQKSSSPILNLVSGNILFYRDIFNYFWYDIIMRKEEIS